MIWAVGCGSGMVLNKFPESLPVFDSDDGGE